MSCALLEKTAAFIAQEKLFPKRASLIVAVSGGVDSMVLLDALNRLGYKLIVAHVNYRLRGEDSDQDAAFVKAKALAMRMHFDYRSSNADELQRMQDGNMQSIARSIRYDWFQQLRKQYGHIPICTAHHLDDNLETMLLQLSRGTSLTGLTGMHPKLENGVCRPFLSQSRASIETYAKQHQIVWREDASNASDNYNRNKIRHQILPALYDLLPDAHQRLATTFDRLRSEEQLFLSGLEALWELALVAPDTIDRNLLPVDQAAATRLLHHKLRPLGFKGDQFRQILAASSGVKIEGHSAQITIRKNLVKISRFTT